ncbi:hypothetical protein K469DRAFT_296169 [Zopfia rhizophila CBS 207.26]|uniref:Uncharacterized protein n=1 Tax=Zopfia rhizophila CBS 207.26 TaxID=1314779 RepID=A0A6A6DQ68_9PEZI|nr:hypothetical protein K469DRAFT_296169 [Zopfia rhizophila CBS 207.26]
MRAFTLGFHISFYSVEGVVGGTLGCTWFELPYCRLSDSAHSPLRMTLAVGLACQVVLIRASSCRSNLRVREADFVFVPSTYTSLLPSSLSPSSSTYLNPVQSFSELG